MSETDCIMAAGELQAIIDRQNRENARVNARTALAQRQAYTAAAELACRMGSEDPSLRRVILFGSTLPQAVDVIALLSAELQSDMSDLQAVAAENTRAWERINHGADDRLDWAALGYTIHNVYGVIENYCLRVAKFFENGLEGTSWHKELIHRMTISIGTLRPVLLDQEAYLLVDELRSFRHLFRNLYARPLDPERTRLVQGKVEPTVQAIHAAHRDFTRQLEVIAAGLDDEG